MRDERHAAARIAVLGLGNLMRTDDAAGMLALQNLRGRPDFPKSVALIEGGTLGLDLIYPLEGVTHLLALDAIDAGAPAGTVLRYAGEAIDHLPVSKSVHLLGFSDLIGSMRLMGNAPSEIVVLGVQPHTIDWGTEPTAVVNRSLNTLVSHALDQVRQWRAEISAETPAEEPSVVPELAAADVAWSW